MSKHLEIEPPFVPLILSPATTGCAPYSCDVGVILWCARRWSPPHVAQVWRKLHSYPVGTHFASMVPVADWTLLWFDGKSRINR